jgi:MFS family permease
MSTEKENVSPAKPVKSHYSLSFWLCFAGLCGTGLISGLDSTVLSTSLPTIIEDLDGGSDYIWVVNVYFLTW